MSSNVRADAPIGVFDSGVGGLTVLRSLRSALPNEDFVYLGDTARVPYGTKSPQTVARYAVNVADLLAAEGCKAMVIACNTASAFGLEAVRESFDGPVIDVIAPVARAVARDANGAVVVLGTRGTVGSGAYPAALRAAAFASDVSQLACPLFVPLAEEGWLDGDVPGRVADHYLGTLTELDSVSDVILGCTHYPLLRGTIAASLARLGATEVRLHDSGPATAHALGAALSADGLDRAGHVGVDRYLVSDDPTGFLQVARRFLGRPVASAEHVHVG